jgi:hypothetical protein
MTLTYLGIFLRINAGRFLMAPLDCGIGVRIILLSCIIAVVFLD